ncbi:MAG: hypothetical protein K2L94_01850 [Alphaproteobacteria bacterium]|nr:hypothetical protein [Alphaproteobacteria bacterium]
MPNLNQRLPCAYAATLHYGTHTVPLTPLKQTSPALAINFGGATYFGALFDDAAPTDTLRINIGGVKYWLGEFCTPGTYAPADTNTCIACGMGHFCTGGHHRAPCTYGAISCPGINHATDAALPSGATINKFLTLDDVNRFIPTTDISDWRKISCCVKHFPEASPSNPDTLNNVQYACATNTIGPGTYLFLTHYNNAKWVDRTDCITQDPGSMSNAVIAVFDHPVSYASIHGYSIFQHFIDIDHPTYTKWTYSTAPTNGSWSTANANETNVTNLASILDVVLTLCVYELK